MDAGSIIIGVLILGALIVIILQLGVICNALTNPPPAPKPPDVIVNALTKAERPELVCGKCGCKGPDVKAVGHCDGSTHDCWAGR